ncbi:MAG: hypothetical protein M3Q42_03080 [Pseudomonadota bacterium]|nr:hypothetical protein [Pseudomonadota bacterium]
MREFVLIAFLVVLGGCAGKHSHRTVQLCLGSEEGVGEFKRAMQLVAQDERMEFADGSVETARKLKAMGQHPGYELVHIGITGRDGVGLTAGNQGLSAYEVAIGFSSGANEAGVQEFESAAIRALNGRWEVYEVPLGQGAFPLKTCRSESGQRQVSAKSSRMRHGLTVELPPIEAAAMTMNRTIGDKG